MGVRKRKMLCNHASVAAGTRHRDNNPEGRYPHLFLNSNFRQRRKFECFNQGNAPPQLLSASCVCGDRVPISVPHGKESLSVWVSGLYFTPRDPMWCCVVSADEMDPPTESTDGI